MSLPRSKYYRRPRGGTETGAAGADLRARIAKIRATHPAYGYRRVTHELHRRSERSNHKPVQRMMRDTLAPPTSRRRPLVSEAGALDHAYV